MNKLKTMRETYCKRARFMRLGRRDKKERGDNKDKEARRKKTQEYEKEEDDVLAKIASAEARLFSQQAIAKSSRKFYKANHHDAHNQFDDGQQDNWTYYHTSDVLYSRVDGTPLYECVYCDTGAGTVRTDCGDVVCFGCGAVLQDTRRILPAASRIGTTAEYSRYKRIAYFNELLVAFIGHPPKIPDDIMSLVRKEIGANKGHYGPIEDFTKQHVREILRSIVIPKKISEKYKTIPRPQNRFKSVQLTSLVKFTERWYYIKNILLDRRPHSVPWQILYLLRKYFLAAEHAWHQVMTGTAHLMSYNYIIVKCLQKIDNESNTTYTCDYRFYWTLPSIQKVIELDEKWKAMTKFLGWVYEPTNIIICLHTIKDKIHKSQHVL